MNICDIDQFIVLSLKIPGINYLLKQDTTSMKTKFLQTKQTNEQ